MKNKHTSNHDMWAYEFRRLGYRVIDIISEYYNSIGTVPVFSPVPSEEVEQVFREPLPLEGQEPDSIIGEWVGWNG